MSILNDIKNEPKVAGWQRRVLERNKNKAVRRALDPTPPLDQSSIVDATPKTMQVGNIKVKNLRPVINALVERRARELMARQMLLLAELNKRGAFESKPKTPTITLTEPALM